MYICGVFVAAVVLDVAVAARERAYTTVYYLLMEKKHRSYFKITYI